jgi:hypothetical protein
MNISKTIILTIAAFFALALLQVITQLLLRKVKAVNADEGKLKLSYAVLFATLFLSGSLIAVKAVSVFSEAIDNIYKINPGNSLLECFKIGSLFIGLSLVWLILWHFIVKAMSVIINGKRNDVKEIESDNYSFFLVRGILLVGFTICFLPVFEIILRSFMPNVQLPFYH